MTVQLDEERRERVISQMQGLFLQEFEEELTPFRARQLLDFFMETIAPQVYNQAVQDARGFMQRKLDDLDGEVYTPEASS